MKPFLFIFFIFLNLHAQINIKVGSEYRITPIYTKSIPVYENASLVVFSEHRQLTGTVFNYTLEYINKSGYGLGFSQSVQYSHIYYEHSDFNANEVKKSVNGILTDFNLFIKKEFYLSNDNFVFIEVGQSLMNSGSTFFETKIVGAYPDGAPRAFGEEKDFNFFATKVNFGYAYNRFDIGLGAFFTKGSELYSTKASSLMILPFFKINYLLKSFD